MREYPFQSARLIDLEVEVDFSDVTTSDDRVAVITTEPLTKNEEWQAYRPGEMILFQGGRPIKTALTTIDRLIREEKNPELKRITKADQY